MLQHMHLIGSPTDGEAVGVLACLASSVDGYQEVMVATLHGERNLLVVGQRQRTDGETVRRHSHDANVPAAGQHDRSAHAECIAGTARRRVDDEPVGLVRRQVLPVDVHADAYHAAVVALEHSHLVQGKGIGLRLPLGVVDLEHAARFLAQTAGEEVVERRGDVVQREARQKSQPAGVDAEDGNLLLPHPHRRGQERAVAAHADSQVCPEGIVGNQFALGDGNMQLAAEEVEERAVHQRNGIMPHQRIEQFQHRSAVLRLISIPEDGTSFSLCHRFVHFVKAKLQINQELRKMN